MSTPPYIPLTLPSALIAHKNGQLPESMLARVNTGGRMYAPVAEQFNKMYDAALAAGFKLRNVGDYRSFQRQVDLFLDRHSTTDYGRVPQVSRSYEGKTWFLKPGKAPAATPDPTGKRGSNHGWGLAIDLAYEHNGKLTGMGGACFDWLCDNAPKYGFYLQTADRKSKYWEAWHWQYCLGDALPDGSPAPTVTTLKEENRGNQSLRKGDKGDAVKAVQLIVGALQDGDFGPKTEAAVKAWQDKHGLVADGIWGNMSDGHAKHCTCKGVDPIPSSAPAKRPYPGKPLRNGSRGEDVKAVQEKIGALQDGWYGKKTTLAVRSYQRSNRLYNDGVVGPKTWGHMFG